MTREFPGGNHTGDCRIPFPGGMVYAMTMARNTDHLGLPSPDAAHRQRVLLRPRATAIACLLVLAGMGWIYLGVMVGQAASAHRALGQGIGLIDLVGNGRFELAGRLLLQTLCQPGFAHGGAAHAETIAPSAAAFVDLALVWMMWCAMTLAMMLPTAGSMILSYAEIAETAARRREAVASPFILITGYVSVWLGFAVLATLLQWGLTRLALLDASLASMGGLFSGAILIAAGLYQFSALKHACLTLCQRPLPFFLAKWSTRPAQVFRLGLHQGLYCLGCCWAMMLVMFAVGLMNILWMAGLGVVMGAEKIATTTRFSRAVGVAFIAVGAAFVVTSVAAHWPVRAA